QHKEPALGIDRGRFEEIDEIIGLPQQILAMKRAALPRAGIGLGQGGCRFGHARSYRASPPLPASYRPDALPATLQSLSENRARSPQSPSPPSPLPGSSRQSISPKTTSPGQAG